MEIRDLAFAQEDLQFVFSDGQQLEDIGLMVLIGQIKFVSFQRPGAIVKMTEVLGIGAAGLQLEIAGPVEYAVPFGGGVARIAVKP